MTRHTGAAICVGLLSVLLVSISGCGNNDDTIEEHASALLFGDRPMGFTCGLAYSARYEPVGPPYPPNTVRPTNWPVDGKCMGTSTIMSSQYWPYLPAAGFGNGNDGDNGQTFGLGFYHQYQAASTGDTDDEEYPQKLLLPKGTACGFKHTCNSSKTLTCMGWNPAVSCPAGWQQRQASDASGANGCNYAWCEYQDPMNLCTSNDCKFNMQPSGIACGVTDSDYPDTHTNPKLAAGRCLGSVTKNGCPPGFTWQWYGKYDAGRSSGHGLAWCTKL
jgi:hypothetical protein